jgi:hypothetical protein
MFCPRQENDMGGKPRLIESWTKTALLNWDKLLAQVLRRADSRAA